MEALANTLAQHALAALLSIAALMLLLTTFVWHVINRYGSRLWSTASRSWERLRKSSFAARLRDVPGLNHVLTGSLTLTRYLGVHALVSFVFAFGALTLFFQVAEEIGVDEDLARFDVLLSHALATYASQALLQFLAIITVLGNKEFLLPFGALVTLILIMQRRRTLAVAWVVATGAGSLLNMTLKAVFERTRPIHEHGFITEDGWSFPSGHASGSMLVYGLLAYILIRHTPRAWHLPVAITAVALIVFVGFSRVLLQVHYLSDVLAGYASASAWGALCIAGYESIRRAKARSARAKEL